MEALEREMQIFCASSLLAERHARRARALWRCHERRRLAHHVDARMSLQALEEAHFYWGVAEDAARRMAKLLDRDRSRQSALAYHI